MSFSRLMCAATAVTSVSIAACTSTTTPASPSSPLANAGTSSASHSDHSDHMAMANTHGADSDKGYIAGWANGEDVELYYTKSFFCADPPASGANTNCELGANAEVAPRPGPIPTIYAIAAAGIAPNISTLSCPPASVCLNHPAMIDASRVLGPGATNIPGVPHSHIVTERRGGWFHTVNIRVRDLGAWNQIAAAKSLDKVRELQADPNFGGRGLVSADTPTNIFFFIASWR
jgi:hypothetical protein